MGMVAECGKQGKAAPGQGALGVRAGHMLR